MCHTAWNPLPQDWQVRLPWWSTILRPAFAPLLRVRARDLTALALLVLTARQAMHHTRSACVPARLAPQPLQALARAALWRALDGVLRPRWPAVPLPGFMLTRGPPGRPVFTP